MLSGNYKTVKWREVNKRCGFFPLKLLKREEKGDMEEERGREERKEEKRKREG